MGICHMAMRVLAACNPHLRIEHRFGCDKSAVSRAFLRANIPGMGRSFVDATAPEFHAEAPVVDLLVAGFPCQPWSLASRKRKGLADPRSHVLAHILQYIVEKRPRAVLLENVCGLLRSPEVLGCITETLEGAGYSVATQVLNSKTHGHVPQSRRRLYIAAVSQHKAVSQLEMANLWPPQISTPSLASILTEAPQSPDSRPRGRVARGRVDLLIDGLKSRGINPHSLSDVVVNCNAISMSVTRGYTPCLTSTRGGEGGFWLLAQNRMMNTEELLRLQGMRPSLMDVSMLSARQAGQMIGAAFTQSVITRLFAGLLQVGGLVESVEDPYGAL
jgi:hypothetical protein